MPNRTGPRIRSRVYGSTMVLYGRGHSSPKPEFRVIVKAVTKARARQVLIEHGIRVVRDELQGWIETADERERGVAARLPEGVWMREAKKTNDPYVEVIAKQE